MIHKSLETNAGKPVMQVTFCLPNSYWADKIHLVGDFNDWNRSSHPLARKKGGAWRITVPLEPNKAYQFRYLIDCQNWTNDDNADAYVRNFHGSNNFVVIADLDFEKYNGD